MSVLKPVAGYVFCPTSAEGTWEVFPVLWGWRHRDRIYSVYIQRTQTWLWAEAGDTHTCARTQWASRLLLSHWSSADRETEREEAKVHQRGSRDIKQIVAITSFIDWPLNQPTLTEAVYDIIFPLPEVTDVWVFTGCSPSEKVSSAPLMSGTNEGGWCRTKQLNFSGNHNIGAECHLDRINFDPTLSCFQEVSQLATQEVPISRQMDSVDCLSCQFGVSRLRACVQKWNLLFVPPLGESVLPLMCLFRRTCNNCQLLWSDFLSLPNYSWVKIILHYILQLF